MQEVQSSSDYPPETAHLMSWNLDPFEHRVRIWGKALEQVPVLNPITLYHPFHLTPVFPSSFGFFCHSSPTYFSNSKGSDHLTVLNYPHYGVASQVYLLSTSSSYFSLPRFCIKLLRAATFQFVFYVTLLMCSWKLSSPLANTILDILPNFLLSGRMTVGCINDW